jgi:hypothetical protein
MSDPTNVADFDTSQVVNPVEHLNGELKGISNLIAEIEGQIATLVVQKARLVLMYDALRTGVEIMFGAEDPEGPP